MLSSRATRPRLSLMLALAAALLAPLPAVASADSPAHAESATAKPQVEQQGKLLVLRVGDAGSPSSYSVRIQTEPLQVTTVRSGRTVLATPPSDGARGPVRFLVGDSWHHATSVRSWHWDEQKGVLSLTLATTSPDHVVDYHITPGSDRYRLDWQVKTSAGANQAAPARSAGESYTLSSAGHWYGHGEVGNRAQPWPLETGQVHDAAFDPSSILQVDPFWFTSAGTGVRVDTTRLMDVAINDGADGLGRFTVTGGDDFHGTVFVERYARDVYRDYIGIVGAPEKIDATYQQVASPLWNSWAQFYQSMDQQKVLQWAHGLADNGLAGHAVQLDNGWEHVWGDLDFDRTKFPDPRAMSQEIHRMGMDFGLWTGLWLRENSAAYAEAERLGYLMRDGTDPTKTCKVYNGVAGIVDLGNPAARKWYDGKLRYLIESYGVDGFKFDTRFYEPQCRPYPGTRPADYLDFGAQAADKYDLQGVGIRISWGRQKYGFVTREADKYTDWQGVQLGVTQALAEVTIGYPFVETDMIGGSLSGPPPEKPVLVRWAQAAALMPLMYSSTSPLGVTDPRTGQTASYDQQTVDLYRDAIERHRKLAPYIWNRSKETVGTGEPVMKPVFFGFPADTQTYTLTDQWLLGSAVMAAPQLTSGTQRDIYLPAGRWLDVRTRTVRNGPTWLHNYPTPLADTPIFVRLGDRHTGEALSALAPGFVPPAAGPSKE
jgi:alpha-glucosidase (family GH31 glycosyl hydrolase)